MSLEDIQELLEDLTSKKKITIVNSRQLAAAGDYGAGDVLSESASAGTAWKFPNAVKERGNSATIKKAIISLGVTGLAWRASLLLFSRLPSGVLNDNVTNTNPILNDLPIFQGVIDFPDTEDLGTGMSYSVVTEGTIGGLPLKVLCEETTLYGILVLKDAETNEVASMTCAVTLVLEQD